jgi:long-chain acyl-CoA synthetase
MIVGEGKDYLAALLTLNGVMIRTWARENERPDQLSVLAQDTEVRALIQLDIDAINNKLATFERIQRFAILPHDFSVAGGELTPTGKLKRGAIARKFANEIEDLYD